MHFRKRGNIIQVIRVTYDEKTKKSKNTIVGKIQRNKPEISDDLKAQCTAEELKDIQDWIESSHALSALKAEYAARTLATQIDAATKWFKNTESGNLHVIAADILPKLVMLRKVMKSKNLI